MTELIYFLGRFHVLVLHLPIGILLLAVLAEILARRERYRILQPAIGFIWLAGALSAVVTVILGYMHASEGGFEGAALNGHRLAGTSLALAASLIWFAHAKFPSAYRRVWPLGAAGIVALLGVTGHFGGNLTHGEAYLARYAPAPLRRLVGVAPRSKPQDLASADIYMDVIAPALEQRCGSCHSESKRKGGLSVMDHDALMRGGESGAVIAAGVPEQSDLFRRITLPDGHDEFMPKDGKTPLTQEQVVAIGWWIGIGAPERGAIAQLAPPSEIQGALRGILGFAASADGASQPRLVRADGDARPRVDVPPPDPAVVADLEANGFVVRAIAVDSPLVQVDYTASRAIAAEDIERLAAIGVQIHSLNLRKAGVSDAHLSVIGKFTHLHTLRLELNPITDAGLAALAGLENLRTLNLYGTRITDKGLEVLSGLEQLDRLFLWQTSVTKNGVAKLQRAHTDLVVDAGFDPSSFPVGPKVIPVVN